MVIHMADNGTVLSASYAVDANTGYARPIIPLQHAAWEANVSLWPGPGVWDPAAKQSCLWWIGVFPNNSPLNVCGGGIATGTYLGAGEADVTFERAFNDTLVQNGDVKTPDEVVASRDGQWMFVFMLRGPPMARDVVVARVAAGAMLQSSLQVCRPGALVAVERCCLPVRDPQPHRRTLRCTRVCVDVVHTD